MSINEYGQYYLAEQEALDALYANPELELHNITYSEFAYSTYNEAIKFFNLDLKPIQYTLYEPRTWDDDGVLTISQFHARRQQVWFMPEEYQNTDVKQLVLARCNTEAERARVHLEFEEYEQKDMLCLLRYLNYMVDTFRAQGIVWGVGRGSSVASFVLYLLGVHKVDSLAYNLDPYEFFK